MKPTQLRQQQLMRPLFEFSGACAGCGETPYLKMLTQLFGDRAVIANATGCSSIYGGNLPTTPYAPTKNGRGPTWCNSLFEDNAEFGLGFRVSIDKQKEFADRIGCTSSRRNSAMTFATLIAPGPTGGRSRNLRSARTRRRPQREARQESNCPRPRLLASIADALVRKSVWIIGGDGWAYDIGYGGLDHVLASGRDVNVLVLDTEVYSNTGGQMSKSTPRGAVAKFAAGGKPAGKKDLGLIAMTYGNIYVASVAMGAKDEHTLRAFVEAESYPGPSLIIAYSHCIAHGIALDQGIGAQASRNWRSIPANGCSIATTHGAPKPARTRSNWIPRAAKGKVKDYLLSENRFKMLTKSKPEDAKKFFAQAQGDADRRWKFYQFMAARDHQNSPKCPRLPNPRPPSTNNLKEYRLWTSPQPISA